MFSISTRIYVLPKVCGKACAWAVVCLWEGCVQALALLHTVFDGHLKPWINQTFTTALYTKVTQTYVACVYNFASVYGRFCTVSTRPTNITTTFI